MSNPSIINITFICTILASTFGLSACNNQAPTSPTVEEAKQFIKESELRLTAIGRESAQAAWIFSNFITYDTESLKSKAREQSITLSVELAAKAKRYETVELHEDDKRKLYLLKSRPYLAAPDDAKQTAELASISSSLESRYAKGQYCPDSNQDQDHDQAQKQCLNLNQMSSIMANSRDPRQLLDLWQGWHSIAAPMRPEYQRLVEIANQGAQDLGYKDLGVLWRSKYDMPADEFAKDYDQQWTTVKPLYQALHCHVRAKLSEAYGHELVQPGKPIPAHLLGNMWAQSWSNLYELIAPKDTNLGYDLTKLIQKSNMTEVEMVKIAEQFFTSLGFKPLPKTFWERSLFVKPQDRDVACHASAWNLDGQDDIRIKMCIQKTAEDFYTIHHELGHNVYQRAYKHQSVLYRHSANDGFHEAIGDTISLSITPKYLVDINLLDKEPDTSKDIGFLLQQALDKIAFLPFGLLIDKWRWQVFSGEISADNYNQAWWQLREHYQGIMPPIKRSESDFDPGAKYHIPANTSYARYFLAFIQQFQFHQALCKAANYTGPLHRCTIYNNLDAGKKLASVLEMGKSRPWPEAMQALTGQPKLDASAMLDYFAPLKTWLDEQNKDRQCGW